MRRRTIGGFLTILFVVIFFRTVFEAGPLRLETVFRDLSEFSFDLFGLSEFFNYIITFDFVPFVGFALDEDLSLGEQILQILKEIFVTPFESIFMLLRSLVDLLINFFDNLINVLKILVKVLGFPDLFPDVPDGGAHRGGR